MKIFARKPAQNSTDKNNKEPSIFPLSSAQIGVWMDQMRDPDIPNYNIGMAVRLDGQLDISLLKQSIQKACDRHDALRTVLRGHEGQGVPVQEVLKTAEAPFRVIDCSEFGDPEEQAWQLMRETLQERFVLEDRLLWQSVLIVVAERRHYWMTCSHHVICDGTGLSIFFNDVCDIYTAAQCGSGGNDHEVPSFIECLSDDESYLKSARAEKDRAYWRDRFAELCPPVSLGHRTRLGDPAATSGLVDWVIDRVRFERLESWARGHGGSMTQLFMALLAGYLARICHTDELVIGIPVHNRSGARQRKVIGMFASLIPIRLRVDSRQSFVEMMKEVAAELRRGYRHQRLPIAQIRHGAHAQGSDSIRLFDVSLTFNLLSADAVLGDIVPKVMRIHHGFESLPLAICIHNYHKEDDVGVEFVFNEGHFDRETVARMVTHLDAMLTAVIDGGEDNRAIRELPLLTEVERDQVLKLFNDTAAEYPRDALIHELFEQQVQKSPDAVAVVYEEEQLSYAQLNAKANQLAHRLRALGVAPDTRVAICVERSLEMVVGLLGILKAGGAYVPVDPEYPDDRIAYILRDAGAPILLTQVRLEDKLRLALDTEAEQAGEGATEAETARTAPVIVHLDEAAAYAGQASTNISARDTGQTSANLAYVIYTSGSTGLPKGVMIEHASLSNLMLEIRQRHALAAGDRLLQFMSFAFDAAVQEIFGSLSSGATLVLRNEAWISDGNNFWRLCRENGITVLHLPAAFWQQLLHEKSTRQCEALRLVIIGGERVDSSVLRRWFECALEHAVLLNEYGPTETTVTASIEQVIDPEASDGLIGKPIANTRIYILDEAGHPVPIGVVGEIHIAGDGVARGYLNRPELTEEKFIADPFSDQVGARMYRTGDLGRWRADGAIEYLGRNDFQVKIRGLRIELGEIEARLTELAQVREAVVLAREDQPGDKRLVAYWTQQSREAVAAVRPEVESDSQTLSDKKGISSDDANAQACVEALREHLKQTLPGYMVPSAFVKLEAMPLTPNGKVDRKALPAPDQSALQSQGYEAPQGETEEVLATIWQALLGVDKVGRHDSFFDLGGHSLLAVQLLARIRQALGQEVTLKALFAAPTVAQTARGLQVADAALLAPIDMADRCLPLQMSWAQQRLWFLEQFEDLGAAYHMPGALRLSGRFDDEALGRALDTLVARHESLRTVFVRGSDEAEAVQQVLPVTAFALARRDLSTLDTTEQQTALNEVLHEATQQRFDLEHGPLIRGELLKLADTEHVLHLCMHHIVSDGWSMGVMFRELAALYAAYSEGRQNPLEPLPIQYVDYAQWQRQWLTAEKLGEQLTFWQQALKGAPTLLELPTDHPRPAVQSYAGTAIEFALDKGVSDGLNALARRHGATLFMVLQAAWTVLLGRLSGQDDVVIGTPVANRRRSELEGLIGFFVNTLALRTRLDPQQTVSALLEQVKQDTLAAYGHQDVPFEQVVEAVRPERSLAHSPLFQTMLVLQNTPQEAFNLAGLKLSAEPLAHESTHFDLTLSLQETTEGLGGFLEYSTALFERETVARWLEHLKVLLGAMVADDGQTLKHLPLLTEQEREQVLRLFNDTAAEYPKDALIHELFEQQVQKSPDAVAVVYEDAQLSYAELNAKANQLAHHLQALGVKSGERVAIIARRGLDSVISELATLKAGAAYVPIDPEVPADRQAFMIEDSEAVAVIAKGAAANPMQDGGKDAALWIDLDEDAARIAACPMHELARVQWSDTALDAYVMYTSGSTGTPKGVLVPHHAVNRLVINNGYVEISPEDAIAHCSNPAFDASTFEIWGALLNGARVVIVPHEQVMDPEQFREVLLEREVSILWLTAGLFNQYADALRDVFVRLKYLLAGGDALDPVTVQKVLKNSPPQNLLNGYGPTETTTFATTCRLNGKVDERTRAVPIGKPIANTRIYILDEAGNPVPIGVAGEIHIAGDGVARGYLNRPELTEEKFIPDPFSGIPGARMYKTGDLGRWRADGTIEYLGRNDFQVKIRGLRIELGEIDARLTELPQVREAVVLAREDLPGDKRLVAYWTAQADAMATSASPADTEEDTQAAGTQDAAILRVYLQEHLPGYMVPAAFVRLEAMPLTSNGKVDRKALPAPDQSALQAQVYEAPQGETEQVLAAIWQALLGVDKVGRHDNFFDLGGHSLLIITLVERLRQKGLKAEIRQVFAAQSLAELAGALQTDQEEEVWRAPANQIPDGCEQITPEMLPLIELTREEVERIVAKVPGGAANVQDIYPLAPLQEGVLFHHRFQQGSDPYVSWAILSFESRQHFNAFVKAWQQVLRRHDVLRTAVVWEGLPQAVQVVWREAGLQTEPLVLGGEGDLQQQLRAYLLDAPLHVDLNQAPLLSLRPVQSAEGGAQERFLAVLLMHHIIMDHVSLEVMLDEVSAMLEGQQHRLAAPVAYRDFVAHCLAKVERHDAEAYFKAQIGDVTEPTAPFGLLDVHGDGLGIEEASRAMEEGIAARVRKAVQRLGMSPAVLFHMAWSLVVAQSSGQDDVVFGSVMSGRMGGIAGVDRMLGMFINTLPVRLSLKGKSVHDAMRAMQRSLVDLLKYEQTPLAEVQRYSGVSGGTPLFSAMLNYRHSKSADNEIALAGMQVLEAQERTNYPFSVSVDDLGEGFLLTAQTQADTVQPQRVVDYLHRAVEQIVQALEEAPQTQVLKLSMLPEAERDQVLRLFNDTVADYPRDALIHELFEQQVQKSPDAVAVIYEDAQLSYAELNDRANQLAHRLRTLGVVPDTRVAICVERSLEMVVGLLGVLKAGGAYVPVDPEYPQDRIAYILRDAGAPILLTQRHLEDGLGGVLKGSCHEDADDERAPASREAPRAAPAGAVVPVVLRLDEEAVYAHSPDGNIRAQETGQTSANLAYVIYTSGSTGLPKGVEICHQNVDRLLKATHDWFSFGSTDVWTMFHSYAFDFSVWEVFGALCTGGRLIVVPYLVSRSPDDFLRLLRREQVTILNQTPSAFGQLTAAPGAYDEPLSLRLVIFGGEALNPGSLASWIKHRGDQSPRLINMYGITETTVHVTYRPILASDLNRDRSPMGLPIPDLGLRVLDAWMNPVPIGVPGELYVAGAGLARGYLNRPHLTSERFIKDPFDEEGGRLYRTGDLVRITTEGELEYLGRVDHQVKIRGLRIELGEIEARLTELAQVREAVVLAREDQPGDKRLVAYWTAQAEATATSALPADTEEDTQTAGSQDAAILRAYLQEHLPGYMVPAAFVKLDAMPLTPNGKVDRLALPAPDLSLHVGRQGFTAPLGPVEESIAAVWKKVLRLDHVGRDDDFFGLGGHSLLTVGVANEMRSAGMEMSIADLFRYRTIAEQAAFLYERVAVSDVDKSLVPFREGGNKNPLFFLHEISGDVLSYFPLSGLICKDVPVYGIRALDVMAGETDLISVESLSERHVSLIRSVQESGPYRLAGWSNGGVFAYEIARQLLNMGEEVEFVGMIDTYVPRCLDGNETSWTASPIRKALLDNNPMVNDGVIDELNGIEDSEELLDRCERLGVMPAGVDKNEVRMRIDFYNRMVDMMKKYLPVPIDVQVDLFMADRSGCDYGWDVVCRKVIHRRIGGDHYSIMRPPYLQILAREISYVVGDCKRNSGSPL